jgi:chromosome segregation ATPase
MSDRLATMSVPGLPGSTRAAAGNPVDLFNRLEERVVQLVERHREAQKALTELEGRLRESHARANRLELELAERDLLREQLRERLDRVIEWVRVLEGAAAQPSEGAGGRAESEGC